MCYVMDHGMTLILNTHQSIEDCRKLCRMFLSLCSQKFAWYRGKNTIPIGIGLAATDPQQIPKLVETAKFAGWMRLSEGKGRVLQYADYENLCHGKHDYLSQEAGDALRRSVADMDEAFMIDTIRDTLQQTDNAGSYIATALSINDLLIEAFNRQGKTAVVENSKYLRLSKNMPPMVENMETLEQIQQAMLQWAKNCMSQLMARSGEKKDAAIYTAKRYISAHYTKPLCLDEVAGQVHLTPSYFCMKFRQETGTTFVEYLTKLRLARAKDLLRHSNKKIHEIAVTVGFANSRHFSRTFYRNCGMHPTEYRAQFHGVDVS